MEDDAQADERRAIALPAAGYLLSGLIVVGGLGVYYFFFKVLVNPLNPADALPEVQPFLWEGQSPESQAVVLAADLNARYAFAVPSVLMLLSFIAALIVAFGLVLPQFGRWAVALGVLSLPLGAAIGWHEQDANPLRTIVADCAPEKAGASCPLDQAALRAPPGWQVFSADELAQVQLLVHLNSMVSVAAIALIAVCAIFIARSVPASQLDIGYLVRRRMGLDAMLTVVGPILVFSVATTHGFYHLSSALMQPSAAQAYRLLASAGTTYWGAVYTTVLLVIAVPAAMSVALDGRRASLEALPHGNFTERLEWRKKEGVELSIRDRIRLTLASFAPVLTAPFLDLLGKSLGK